MPKQFSSSCPPNKSSGLNTKLQLLPPKGTAYYLTNGNGDTAQDSLSPSQKNIAHRTKRPIGIEKVQFRLKSE